MNRLIIVGNGFDLAHGLKTRYTDFLLWYLKDCLKQSGKNIHSQLFDITFKRVIINDSIYQTNDLKSFFEFAKYSGIEINGKDTYFTRDIIDNLEIKNWVDLEHLFYKNLIKRFKIIKENIQSEKPQSTIDKGVDLLKGLNQTMDILKSELVRYLLEEEEKFNFKNINSELIESIISENLFSEKNGVEGSVYNVRILNFNYTNLVSNYIIKINKDYVKELQIHGKLGNPESVVFGFGDEYDSKYKEIEELNINEFFNNIKSFKYFQNSVYQDLMSFINSGEKLEVVVLGHSLGLSDRTMLSEIFNSENLHFVKLFFHLKDDTDDYVEKTHEISRHFKDNAKMRVKIASKLDSSPMPKII